MPADEHPDERGRGGRGQPDRRQDEHTVILEGTGRLKGAGELADRGVLLVLSGEPFGRSFVLDKAEARIGRSPSCDLVLPDPRISSLHCRVYREADGFCLEDLGSTNSTILNQKPLKKAARLHYGDRIVIGETALRFFLEERLIRR